jgi:putative membrane protein
MPHTLIFLFFSGFIAICAMILPGISGSFILVLLGQYEYILSAVSDRDFITLVVVARAPLWGWEPLLKC